MARKKLGEILLDAGVLDQSRLRAALVEQRRWGGHLGRILVDMKLVSEEILVQALSQQLNFPAINLDSRDVPDDVLALVPGDLAESWSLIPFHKEGKFLDVAMVDPTNMGVIDELRIRTQLNVRPYLAGPKMIERALGRYYNRGAVSFQAGVGARPSGPVMSVAGEAVLDFGSGRSERAAAAPLTAAQRRAAGLELAGGPPPSSSAPPARDYGPEVANLQERIARLEALIARDEDVIRKLMSLLVEKRVASREEILERIK